MKKWITLGLALVLFTGICSAESEMNKLEVEGPVKNLIVWREVGGQVSGEKKVYEFSREGSLEKMQKRLNSVPMENTSYDHRERPTKISGMTGDEQMLFIYEEEPQLFSATKNGKKQLEGKLNEQGKPLVVKILSEKDQTLLGEQHFEYDGRGNEVVVSFFKTDQAGELQVGAVTKRVFNEKNQKISETITRGSQSFSSEYFYTEKGFLEKVLATNAAGKQVEYQFKYEKLDKQGNWLERSCIKAGTVVFVEKHQLGYY